MCPEGGGGLLPGPLLVCATPTPSCFVTVPPIPCCSVSRARQVPGSKVQLCPPPTVGGAQVLTPVQSSTARVTSPAPLCPEF